MINILIDGNYIFHKTFGIFGGYGKNPGDVLGSEDDQAMFIRKISMDLCYSLNQLPPAERIVFTSDSRSWRKDVEIENGGYKNKDKDETADWTIFYSLLSSFGANLEDKGFIFSKSDKAEGDDLLYFWADYFGSKGEDCIIITGDKDMHQLARWKGDNWTIIWNVSSKNNILSTPIGWSDKFLSSDSVSSIFNITSAMNTDKKVLKELTQKVMINEVDPWKFIFTKMVLGDKGDTVPGIWDRTENDKTYKVTPAKAEKILDAVSSSEWKDVPFRELINDESFLDWISGVSLRVIKEIDSSENRKKAKKNLLRNYTLMWLDKTVIPLDVIGLVLKDMKRGISMERRAIIIDRIKILEGTTREDTQGVPSIFNPFNKI